MAPSHIKTRDWNLYNMLTGHGIKGSVHTDQRKAASKNACRGENKQMSRPKHNIAIRTFDWTRPALHGDELFEIHYDELTGEIVAAVLIDEEGDEIPFNLKSFNGEELEQIQQRAQNGD